VTESADTREALIASGLRCFADRGYTDSRLVDIARGADLTTGAFYRHFASKVAFFHELLSRYGEELQSSLDAATSLSDQIVAWVMVSRRYRGVIRASAEIARPQTPEAAARQRLRDVCANLLTRHVEPQGSWRATRAAALMLVDVLDQYVLMETAGWTAERDPEAVAAGLTGLVVNGLYVGEPAGSTSG
jgi:AcrR family transcriptional regulator